MWPCTQTVDTSLIMKQTVGPAWINMPGDTSFCTTTPAIGARTASSVLIAVPCFSAWSISCAVMPKIFSGCRLFCTSVVASL